MINLKKEGGPRGPSEYVIDHPSIKTDANVAVRTVHNEVQEDHQLTLKQGRVVLKRRTPARDDDGPDDNDRIYQRLMKDGWTDRTEWPTVKSVPAAEAPKPTPRQFREARFRHKLADDSKPVSGSVAFHLPRAPGEKINRQVQVAFEDNYVTVKDFAIYRKMLKDGWAADRVKFKEGKS